MKTEKTSLRESSNQCQKSNQAHLTGRLSIDTIPCSSIEQNEEFRKLSLNDKLILLSEKKDAFKNDVSSKNSGLPIVFLKFILIFFEESFVEKSNSVSSTTDIQLTPYRRQNEHSLMFLEDG